MKVTCEKCDNALELSEWTADWDDFPETELICKCGYVNKFQVYNGEILQILNHTLHRKVSNE